jgi:hypothetical protein
MTQEALSPIDAVIICQVTRQATDEVIPKPTRRVTIWGVPASNAYQCINQTNDCLIAHHWHERSSTRRRMYR